jgi:4a-hydroxytetrahydrobiopterin dehydratase
MPPLNKTQVTRGLRSLPQWSRRSRTIRRTFEFKGFMDAIAFVDRVAIRAEKSDHHPDIDIRWNRVTLALTTHSEGGLTAKDFAMARLCDRVFSRHFDRRQARAFLMR